MSLVCALFALYTISDNIYPFPDCHDPPFKGNVKTFQLLLNGILSCLPRFVFLSTTQSCMLTHALSHPQQKAYTSWKILPKGACCLELLNFSRTRAFILEFSIRLITNLILLQIQFTFLIQCNELTNLVLLNQHPANFRVEKKLLQQNLKSHYIVPAT